MMEKVNSSKGVVIKMKRISGFLALALAVGFAFFGMSAQAKACDTVSHCGVSRVLVRQDVVAVQVADVVRVVPTVTVVSPFVEVQTVFVNRPVVVNKVQVVEKVQVRNVKVVEKVQVRNVKVVNKVQVNKVNVRVRSSH